MNRIRLVVLTLLAGSALAACARPTGPAPTPYPTTDPVDRQMRVFDALWSAIHEDYLYSGHDGILWEGLRADAQSQIRGGLTNAEFEEAIQSLVAQLPQNSVTYQTRSQRIEAELASSAQYSGIGAYIAVRAEPAPHIVVLSIITDSPAQAAGLQAHDSIYSIDGQPVTAAEGMDVVKRVRGDAGTTVTLEVQSPGERRRTVAITRSRLTASDTLKSIPSLLEARGVFYLLLPVSGDATLAQTLTQGLDSLGRQTAVNGIILDLRIARAGIGGWPLTEMLALFGDGDLGEFYSQDLSEPLQLAGSDVGKSQSLPLAILVGPDTSGAPEIFAAALQASRRATLIGLPTNGKIFGYTGVALPDGSQLTLATRSYRTAAGLDLGQSGVQPDIVIAADWDAVNVLNDPILDKAVEVVSGGR